MPFDGEYASYKPSNGQIETEAIVDPEKDHYEVMHVGWDGPRRIHGSVIHIDIIGDQVWIQYDGEERCDSPLEIAVAEATWSLFAKSGALQRIAAMPKRTNIR